MLQILQQSGSTSLGLKRESSFDWEGLRSCKFKNTIRFQPKEDLIRFSIFFVDEDFEMPDQQSALGRAHLREHETVEKYH